MYETLDFKWANTLFGSLDSYGAHPPCTSVPAVDEKKKRLFYSATHDSDHDPAKYYYVIYDINNLELTS